MKENTKASGIEWIRDVPESWNIAKLKYCLDIPLQYGANESGEDFEETYPRYIRITDITSTNTLKDHGKVSLLPSIAKPYLLQDGDVLFARSGATVGKTFYFDSCYGESAFAGYLIRARTNSKMILSKYLYYTTLGNGYESWKDMVFSQATIQNIGADKYNEFVLAVPTLDEQALIVNFLDEQCKESDSIATDIEMQIELLQKYKKSLITETVIKGLDHSIPMKNSGIDFGYQISEEFVETKLKYLCMMFSGSNLTSDDIEDDGEYPVYGGNGLRGYFNRFNVNGKHTVVGRQGALCGNVHLVNGKFWATDHAIVVYHNRNIMVEYLFYLLVAMNLNKHSQTAAQPGLAVNMIMNLRTCIPKSIIEQTQIANYLDKQCSKIDSIIESKKEQLTKIMQHKKSLIYEYVTGKKRVKGVSYNGS